MYHVSGLDNLFLLTYLLKPLRDPLPSLRFALYGMNQDLHVWAHSLAHTRVALRLTFLTQMFENNLK